MNAADVRKSMACLANKSIAEHSRRFFKTGKGEYGEGDRFLGIRVPVVRKQARQFRNLSLPETTKLLKSRQHEERQCALFILVRKFEKGSESDRHIIYRLYLSHTKFINNWDLVDGTAHQIVGGYLLDRDRKPLYQLVKSKNLWERRISIIACYHFIKLGQFSDALSLSDALIGDSEDLIHKAVGWMLREVGNRHLAVEEQFLKSRYNTMPRTMLRYAIEKFPEAKRKRYLNGAV